MRHDKTWYICEDSDTFYIGNSADLFDYLERRSVLPYIVFYQTCEDELDETPEFDKTVRDTNKRDEVIKSEKRKVKNDKGVGELRNESMNKDYNDINKILNQGETLIISIDKFINSNICEEYTVLHFVLAPHKIEEILIICIFHFFNYFFRK